MLFCSAERWRSVGYWNLQFILLLASNSCSLVLYHVTYVNMLFSRDINILLIIKALWSPSIEQRVTRMELCWWLSILKTSHRQYLRSFSQQAVFLLYTDVAITTQLFGLVCFQMGLFQIYFHTFITHRFYTFENGLTITICNAIAFPLDI